MINLAYKILHPIRNATYRTLGAKTMGARALVIYKNQALLIRHTYQQGWYTIGGGVERNESPRNTILRELDEEVGLVPTEEPRLFSVYHSNFEKRDDYIAFYVVRNFEMTEKYSPEVAEKKWFSFDALPLDITPATARRIEEVMGKRDVSDTW